MSRARETVLVGLLAASAACAHLIQISPDASMVREARNPTIDRKVGYFIPEELRLSERTSPGGGGDKVRYYPYKDLETGIFRALRAVFTDVRRIDSLEDQEKLDSLGIELVLIPTILTSSSSSNPIAWPPTDFSVTIDARIQDRAGAEVWRKTVHGEGSASFGEMQDDFAKAAREASALALDALETALASANGLPRANTVQDASP